MPGFCIFYTERNKQKNVDYEKATLVIYGNMFGSDARFAIMSLQQPIKPFVALVAVSS